MIPIFSLISLLLICPQNSQIYVKNVDNGVCIMCDNATPEVFDDFIVYDFLEEPQFICENAVIDSIEVIWSELGEAPDGWIPNKVIK